ncbi:MAG TPA: tetratricopeptide repeat protein [Candidatus Melainabacteria bacterium]|nr:tetratricopeptide repeat protein [Candidatus Melainabacteria bacterium]
MDIETKGLSFEHTKPSKPSAQHLIPGLYQLAQCWFERGDKAPAEKIYRLILKIDERVNGIDCGEVVLSSFDLAQILANSGRYMEAEHQYLETINRCTQSLGQDHPIFALTLNSYSVLLRKMKMDEQAASMEQRVQEMSQGTTPKQKNPEYGSYTAPEKKGISSATMG